MNEVLVWSSSASLIWLYPENPSMNDSVSFFLFKKNIYNKEFEENHLLGKLCWGCVSLKHSNSSIFLSYRDYVGYPIWIVHCTYKSSLRELSHFVFDLLLYIRRQLTLFLLYWFGLTPSLSIRRCSTNEESHVFIWKRKNGEVFFMECDLFFRGEREALIFVILRFSGQVYIWSVFDDGFWFVFKPLEYTFEFFFTRGIIFLGLIYSASHWVGSYFFFYRVLRGKDLRIE